MSAQPYKYWPAGAGVVVASVSVDTAGRSALIVLPLGVRPGTRYPLCKHVYRIHAQGKKEAIFRAPVSIYRTFSMELLLCRLQDYCCSLNKHLMRHKYITLSGTCCTVPAAATYLTWGMLMGHSIKQRHPFCATSH